MSDEKLRAKLAKLLELARRGVDGEQVNAQAFLDRLLKQHGLTLADIESEATEPHTFSYKNALERELLFQVIFSVCDIHNVNYRHPRRSRWISVELTRAQALEVDLAFETYRRAFAAEQKRLLDAFIAANDIFPRSERTTDEEPEPLDEEELRKLVAMMRAMRPTAVPRAAIGAGE